MCILNPSPGALFLGRDFSALDNDEEPEFLQWMDDFFAVTALRWFAPWIAVVLKYLPVAFIQHFLGAQKRSYEYGRKAFNEYINQYGRFSGRIDLLTKMVGTPESAPLTDEEISDELGSLLVGATDTTVVVSTWMLWELAQRPGWQSRIREELHSKSVEFPNGVPSYQRIASLSILHGFIMESMRLHPAQSIGLPRVAGTSEAKLGGITVPAGVCTVPRDPLVHEIVTDSIGLRQTYVSVQSRNVHRDPEIFPSPNDFLPERWIDTSGGTNEMKDSFIIFSKGSRSCLGQYVAFMELKLVIASLLNGWSMKLGVKTTDEVMKQTDFFLAFPKARKCWLLFEKVNSKKRNTIILT